MKGWKTWAASIITGLTGLIMCLEAVIAESFDPNKFYTGLMTIGGAFGIVGIGHKIEKSKQ